MMDKKTVGKIIGATAVVLGTAFVAMSIVAKAKKGSSVYDDEPKQKNPLQGKKVVFVPDENDNENADGARGHLEAVGESDYKPGVYDKYFKRAIDIVLSFGGLVVLSPVYATIALAIKIDDPGPVLFTQKRMGQNKEYFKLHKFRSMKMCTPHDVPTHMLENPEQYITKVGKFLRAHSLDELPQIWDIFIGNMSVIGPRPGLWNQDILTAERDKYGANDVKPGLTGWAQINGRDELEIPDKAKLDGEYVEKLGLGMDIKCFLGSVGVFAHDDSVIEGGTGLINNTNELPLPTIAECSVDIDYTEHKKILIAGTGSYIGESFKNYMSQFENYEIDSFDTMSIEWRDIDFSSYDVVYDVAGIAHIKETDENRHLYYEVNRDLAVEIAEKAKANGVKQFIYLSSMSVYGLTVGRICETTPVNPVNAYGKSKLEAERLLWQLADDDFIVSIVRPPMVYGEGCKGNYQLLRKFALKFGFFPDYDNERSMIYIDNLSSAVRGIIHNCKAGLYFPQNLDYVKTFDMVKEITEANGKKFKGTKVINLPVKVLTDKIGLFKKVFGTLTYDKCMNVPNEWIDMKKKSKSINKIEAKELAKKKILLVTFSNISDHQDKVVGLYEAMLNKCDAYLMVADDVQVPVEKTNKTWLVRCPKRPGICKATFDAISLHRIIKKVREEKFDVIFFETLHVWNLPILIAAGKHTTTYQMIHDVIPHGGDSGAKMVDLMNKTVCKLADNIIICNTRFKDVLCERYGISENRVFCTLLWERFPEYNFKKRTGRVLFFGRLNPYKGVDNLQKIITLCPEFQFDVIGKVDSQVQDIIDVIGKEPNVKLNNEYVPEEAIEGIFGNADWILLPYNSATQSGIVLDAYKFSKPVIAFNVGAIAEQVKDGVSGYLIEPGNNIAFAQKMKEVNQMSDQEYENFCKQTYEYGAYNFATSGAVNRFMDIFFK